jgi:shikimate 5-dehydrogenase
MRAMNLDAVFVAIDVLDFGAALRAMQAENRRGLAVTAPHKESAFAHAVAHDAASLCARASNTLVRDAARWRGANTDVAAVRALLQRERSADELRATRALVLGAGGAARAALAALEAVGASCSVSARNLAAAQALAQEFGAVVVPWETRDSASFELLVQCTPSAELLVAEESIRAGALVIDALYRPARSELLLAAKRRGATAIPGAAWFFEQARAQFELFHARAASEDVLREEIKRALA